jgi:hypothetical protein
MMGMGFGEAIATKVQDDALIRTFGNSDGLV